METPSRLATGPLLFESIVALEMYKKNRSPPFYLYSCCLLIRRFWQHTHTRYEWRGLSSSSSSSIFSPLYILWQRLAIFKYMKLACSNSRPVPIFVDQLECALEDGQCKHHAGAQRNELSHRLFILSRLRFNIEPVSFLYDIAKDDDDVSKKIKQVLSYKTSFFVLRSK